MVDCSDWSAPSMANLRLAATRCSFFPPFSLRNSERGVNDQKIGFYEAKSPRYPSFGEDMFSAKCHLCEKRYTFKRALRRHLKVHTVSSAATTT